MRTWLRVSLWEPDYDRAAIGRVEPSLGVSRRIEVDVRRETALGWRPISTPTTVSAPSRAGLPPASTMAGLHAGEQRTRASRPCSSRARE